MPWHVVRTGARALSWVTLGSLAGAGAAFVTQMMLARALGPAEFGLFAAALATGTFLAPLAGLGVPGFWLKIFGQEDTRAARWLGPSYRFIVLSSAITVLGLMLWTLLGPHAALMTVVLLGMLPHVPARAAVDLVSSRLQLQERYATLALWQVGPHFGRFAAVGVLLAIGVGTAVSAAWAYGLIGVVVVVFAVRRLRVFHRPPEPGETIPSVSAVAASAWPFGLGSFLHLVHYQAAVVLVAYLAGEEAAGAYGVAVALMTALYLLPTVAYSRFIVHRLHRWAYHDRGRLRRAHGIGMLLMSSLGLAATGLMWLLAPWVVPMLLGDAYVATIPLLMVMGAAAPFRFFAIAVGSVLMTRDGMPRKAAIMAAVAALNVLLNLALIPRYGAMGAALAIVTSEAVLAAIYLLAVRRNLVSR